MTFTSSPGKDVLASGIRFEGMWVERIKRYTHRGRNTEAGGFSFFFFRVTVGISAYADLLYDIDGL